MTDYLTVADILAIHEDQIERYGGRSGVRDLGLLESAVYRPQSGYYPDLIAEAASLWESLSRNHPFVDGNKRVGFAATFTFLAINGVRIVTDPIAAFAFISELFETGRFRFDALDPWLRAHTQPEERR